MPLFFLYSVRISSVGANTGIWTYPIFPSALRKYLRSSFLAKPASWELLFKRASTIFLMPVLINLPKNCSADFFVNPIVYILIMLMLFSHSFRRYFIRFAFTLLYIGDPISLSIVCTLDQGVWVCVFEHIRMKL